MRTNLQTYVKMVPAQQCVPAVVANLLQGQPLSHAKVSFAWRTAVGQATARATQATLKGGTLEVRANGEHWRLEIVRAADLIVERLSTLLGRNLVRRISVISKHLLPTSDRLE